MPSPAGLHPPAAAAPITQLNATQHASQLGGLDVPMLEELLPLNDLHDPFLAAAWDAPPLSHRHHAVNPTDHPAVPSALFAGTPAYAEPGSPGAALLNNAAHGLALDSHTGLPPAPHVHPELGSLVPTAFGSPGLAPSIATAQQHAQAAPHSQRAHSGDNSLASDGSAASGAADGSGALPLLLGAGLPRSDDSSAAHSKGEGRRCEAGAAPATPFRPCCVPSMLRAC